MKILVVDDEKTLVKGMKFNLENEGYEVECAYDGAAALELAREGRFTQDGQLPGLPAHGAQQPDTPLQQTASIPVCPSQPVLQEQHPLPQGGGTGAVFAR